MALSWRHRLCRRPLLLASKTGPSARKNPRIRLEVLEDRSLPSTTVAVGPTVDISQMAGNQLQPTIAVDSVNPLRLFAASNIESAAPGAFGAFSTDGGTTWTGSIMLTGPNSLPGASGDVRAEFDRFGNLFVAYVSTTKDVELLWSTDGGATLRLLQSFPDAGASLPVLASGPQSLWIAYHDHNNMIAAAGAQVTGATPANIGAFTPVQEIPSSLNGLYPDVAISPKGKILVAFQQPGAPSQIMASLNSGGVGGQFLTPAFVSTTNVGLNDMSVPAQSNQFGINAGISIGWDRSVRPFSNRLYLAYTDKASTTGADTNIFLRHSDDNGTTWSAPLRVNDDAGTNSQFMPSLVVDQTTENVGVQWYDARNDPNNINTQIFAAFSPDGGATFLPNVLVSAGSSNSLDSEPPDAPGLPALGYGFYANTSAFYHGNFYSVWADNSNSTGNNPDGANKKLDIATACIFVNSDPTFSGLSVTTNAVTEGSSLVVSGAIDDPEIFFQSHIVDINWGDGTADSVQSLPAQTTLFAATSHTYAEESATPVVLTVTVGDSAGGMSSQTFNIAVNDASLSGASVTVHPVLGQSFSGQVATFLDGNPTPDINDLSAVINWGDGSLTSSGQIVANGQGFSVLGNHMYTNVGTFPLTVQVADLGGSMTTINSTAVPTPAPIRAMTIPEPFIETRPLSGIIGTFTDTDSTPRPASDYTATIDWGDNSPTSTGTLTPLGNNQFQVNSSHTYAADGVYPLSFTVSNVRGATITVVTPTPVANLNTIATGADVGAGPEVRIFDSVTGALLGSFNAFDPIFKGGVRVAVGDVDGTGIPDIITAAGPGGGPQIRVFNEITAQQIAGPLGSFYAFEPDFHGGISVASGDFNNDGHADIVVARDAGGTPEIKIFSGADGSILADFMAYSTLFTGGVHIAVADVNGDGIPDIITGAGAGGGPHVQVFDGSNVNHVLASFYAYDPSFAGGVFVSGGEIEGLDTHAEIITSPGAGMAPLVKVFDGATFALQQSFNAYASVFQGGVRVGVVEDPTNAGKLGIITAAGPGGGPHVEVFDGVTAQAIDSFYSYSSFVTEGVFVGGFA